MGIELSLQAFGDCRYDSPDKKVVYRRGHAQAEAASVGIVFLPGAIWKPADHRSPATVVCSGRIVVEYVLELRKIGSCKS